VCGVKLCMFVKGVCMFDDDVCVLLIVIYAFYISYIYVKVFSKL
jgi:hypothetical protein